MNLKSLLAKVWSAAVLPSAVLPCGVLGAQNPRATEVVIPPAFATAEAPGTSFWAFTPFASHQQVLVDSALLGPVRNRQIWGIGVRRNMGDTSDNVGGRLQIELWMSHSQQAASALSDGFGANRGFDHRRVFSGTVTLPPAPAAPSVPAPWVDPWAVVIRFARPFPYVGGTLCVETITTAAPQQEPEPDPPWWPIDTQVLPLAGQVAVRGQSCIPGLPGQPAAADASGLTPGGVATVWLRGPRRGFGALCMIGLDDRWFGALPLPFDLGSLGAPGCVLWNDWLQVMPAMVAGLPAASFGYGSVSLSAPLDPGLLGQSLLAQWVVPEPGRSPLGVSVSNGVVATFGPAAPANGFGWLESTVLASGTGRRLAGRAPVLKLFLTRQ